MKAMAKNPDDRYASAEELRADLLRFADGRPVEAGDPAVTTMMAAAGVTSTTMMAGHTQALPPVDQVSDEADAERKKRTRRLVALLILLLVALGIIAYFLLRSVGVFGATVTVPNVVGDTRAAATQTLQNDQLTVGRTTYRADPATRGIVLSTNPGAGALVSKNSAVDLVVSGGPRTVQVPNVVGELPTNAGATLTRAGLSVGGTSSECSNQYPSGTVSGQNPTVGNSVSAGTTVDIIISTGSCAPPTTIPPPTTTTTAPPPTTTTTAPPPTTTTAPPTTTTTTTTAPPAAPAPAAVTPIRGHSGR
jgi:serine/threonine-protein kinase